MSVVRRVLAALPLVVVTLLFAWASGSWIVGAMLTVAIVGSTALAWRASVGPTGQRVMFFMCAAAGALLGYLHAPLRGQGPGTLPPAAVGVALAALFLASARLYVKKAGRGDTAGFALGLLALAASGETRVGPAYAVAAVLFLGLGFLATRAQDDSRPPLGVLPRRYKTAGGAALALAVVLGGATAVMLPVLHGWAVSRIIRAFDTTPNGFTDPLGNMRLTALDGMLQSDEEVVRLYGPQADYLRGIVYDKYDEGVWSNRRPESFAPIDARAGKPAGDGVVELHILDARDDRYFLPLDARRLATSDGRALVGTFGSLSGNDRGSVVYWFELGERDLPLAGPRQSDLQIPQRIADPVRAIANEWTAGTTSPEEAITAIIDHLSKGYLYSLEFERGPGDPLLDFLTTHREGHCEYFASAMAVLARADHIPTRVIAGYRVAEYDPIGKYWLVREKNAHAWVEAYLPGRGWVAFDPTPIADLPQDRRHDASFMSALARAASESLGRAWSRLGAWVQRLSLTTVLLALAGAVAMGMLVRWLRQRRRVQATARGEDVAVQRALACFDRLADGLARRGITRAPSEPLERFARRLEASPHAGAAELVERYSALRYGGLGDPSSIETAMDRFAEGLGRAGD